MSNWRFQNGTCSSSAHSDRTVIRFVYVDLYFILTATSAIACASGMIPLSDSNVTLHIPTIGSMDVMENLSSGLSCPEYLTL